MGDGSIVSDKERVLEAEIKALLLDQLKGSGRLSDDTSIMNEFTIDKYSRRVDLAILDKNQLIAFEIKSEGDNLNRLIGQTNKYLEYFDKVVVVAASKHIAKVKNMVPLQVGVWEIKHDRLKIRRRGKINIIKNKEKLVDFMKVGELSKLSRKLDLVPDKKNRGSFEKVLLSAPISKLRSGALQSLRERFSKSTSEFMAHIRDSNVSPKDIELLSHYITSRHASKIAAEKNNIAWRKWEAGQDDDPYLLALARKNERPLFGKVPKNIKLLMSN